MSARSGSMGPAAGLTLALTLAGVLFAPPHSLGDPPIADNSFLVEEAYNQEARVVQHIGNWVRGRDGGWAFAFTQEWPLGGARHQVSYTVPVEHLPGGAGGASGLGDLSLNYRLQCLGVGGGAVAFAPRVSLLLPTGEEQKGLGTGGAALEVNLPLSLALGERWVTHTNAGAAWVRGSQRAAPPGRAARRFRAGQSVIWLAAARVNALFELFYQHDAIRDLGDPDREDVLLLSPGIRWAYNLGSELAGGPQIVPGIAFPIGLGPSRGERALYLYLSVEHAF
jgi:hypothetical protein